MCSQSSFTTLNLEDIEMINIRKDNYIEDGVLSEEMKQVPRRVYSGRISERYL